MDVVCIQVLYGAPSSVLTVVAFSLVYTELGFVLIVVAFSSMYPELGFVLTVVAFSSVYSVQCIQTLCRKLHSVQCIQFSVYRAWVCSYCCCIQTLGLF